MVGKQKVRQCIQEAWAVLPRGGQRSIMEMFGGIRRSLSRWKRETGNNSRERMCILRKELESEYSNSST